MKKSRYTETQIMAILKQIENSVPDANTCREHGISSASFCNRCPRHGGMDAGPMARVKELEEADKRFKIWKDQKRPSGAFPPNDLCQDCPEFCALSWYP